MELNIVTILYIFFRLAPFIIVCFFTLQSIFYQDLKGIIYLVGLLLTCFISTLVGNIPGFQKMSTSVNGVPVSVNQMCRFIELSKNGPISNLPLGQTVLAYTFSYLIYVILKYNLVSQNIPTLIVFPVMILGDFFWNLTHSCASMMTLLLAGVIGMLCGILWGYIIDSTGKVDLQLFNGVSNAEVCSRPSRTIYRCRLRRKNA